MAARDGESEGDDGNGVGSDGSNDEHTQHCGCGMSKRWSGSTCNEGGDGIWQSTAAVNSDERR